jgi:hypothetical protein
MNNATSAIIDKLLTNSINLFRLTASEQKKAIRLINALKKDLVSKLANDIPDYFNKTQIKKLISETDEIIRDYYVRLHIGIDETLQGVALHEAQITTQSMIGIGIEASLPTQTVLKSVISDMLILGSPAKDWWSKQADKMAFDFAAQVRQGVISGETNAMIIARVTPIINQSAQGAAALVHTAIQTISTDARLATFQQNADIAPTVEWCSAFDGIICVECAARDGLQWDTLTLEPVGDTIPYESCPLHVNCRCQIIPVVKSLSELAGVKVPEPLPGERASDEGPISDKITMNSFLKGKSQEYLDDLLGKGKAEMFKSGKITLRDLVSGKGRELTLKELQAKYS